MNPRLYSFIGGKQGGWTVISTRAVVGDSLQAVDRLDIVNGAVMAMPDGGKWICCRRVTSNQRDATRLEKEDLVKKQATLGRPASTYAALIPIRKSPQWWALTQDERRAIFEERSHHIQIGSNICRRWPGDCTIAATWA